MNYMQIYKNKEEKSFRTFFLQKKIAVSEVDITPYWV